MRRRLLAVAEKLLGALLLAALFVVTSYLSFNLWVRRGATAVPDLAGLSEPEARAVLVEHGLGFRRADFERFSDRVPAGDVLESRPASGSYVKRGAEVEVVLSRGEHRVVVPELAGKSRAAARLTLEGQGLAEGATLEVFSARGPAGTVIGQHPLAGHEVAAGAPVVLLVARGGSSPAWVMPDLVARRYDPVRAALEAQGFRFGSVAVEPYEGAVAGTILRQTPPPGHPLRRADAISLVVAGESGGAGP